VNAETGTTGVATWTDAAWRAAALEWAVARLAERGLALDGEPEQPHVRAWSTAFRLPVHAGAVWLKSVGPGSAQEPPLVEALGEWVPEHVLVPLAVHRERRLMVLPDGGTTMRAAGRAGSAETWAAMLGDYARLQVALVPRADALVGLGVPDLRPERLPDLVTDLLRDDEFLPAELLDDSDVDGVRTLSRRLADGGIPATLQHDDLHDANVFADGDRHRFFDWGDASVAHPFVSLLVPLGVAAEALGVPNGDPALLRLRDAYLEAWRAYGSPPELRAQAALAVRVGALSRAITWRRILRGVHPAERAEWRGAVPGWAREFRGPGILAGETEIASDGRFCSALCEQ
jgi:hypothetical protein